MIFEGAEKLGMALNENEDIRVILSSDGTEVEDDDTLAAISSEPLILLRNGEVWFPEIVGANITEVVSEIQQTSAETDATFSVDPSASTACPSTSTAGASTSTAV